MKTKPRDMKISNHPKRHGKVTALLKVKPAKETVSVAGIFKRRSKGATRGSKTRKEVSSTVRHVKDQSTVKEPGHRKTSEEPAAVPEQKRASEQHPLVQKFNETTAAYKTHLLNTATTALDDTFTNLTQTLSDATLHTVPNTSLSHPTSPLRLTLAEMIQHELSELSIPFSQCCLIRSYTDDNGEKVAGEMTIEAATGVFAELSSTAEQQMQYLKERWERIVGEIWKCGVQVLGEEEMGYLLATETLHNGSDKDEGEEDVEEDDDALFVPVKYTSALSEQDPSNRKKQVSFQEPIPEFLSQPSILHTPVSPLPTIAADVVEGLETQLNKLGVVQTMEFKQLDIEYKQWWNRKYTQLAKVMEE